MLTLASVTVCIVLGLVLGLVAGIALWRWPRLEAVLNPVFDVMQTIPPFSSLVPVLILFGFGPVAALVATLIFALPPMAKATAYALRRVPESVLELAEMTGANFLQLQRKILLSSARTDILLGLNQLVMMSLAMVILASMIGAGGLGGEVLKALQTLRFGRGLEAGFAITLMAIHLYSFGHAAATRRPSHAAGPENRRRLLVAGAFVLLCVLAAVAVPGFRQFPEAWTMTSSDVLARGISWLNTNLGWAFEAFHTVTTLWLLRPLLDFLQGIGWFAMSVALVFLAFAVGRPRLAILSTLTVLTIAAIGYWDLSMITLHLVIAGTLLSLLIGVPVGILAATSPRVYTVTSAIVTLLQTLPSFVYLIPIVMLLGPGDVSGILAIAHLLQGAPAARRARLDPGVEPDADDGRRHGGDHRAYRLARAGARDDRRHRQGRGQARLVAGLTISALAILIGQRRRNGCRHRRVRNRRPGRNPDPDGWPARVRRYRNCSRRHPLGDPQTDGPGRR